jgi:hypothetical protein
MFFSRPYLNSYNDFLYNGSGPRTPNRLLAYDNGLKYLGSHVYLSAA